ncbi:MAG: hypothetical protein LBS23_01575, partial [Holosporaceae bacterium]|nr:hypothetical protein [Holosporaceae bacterium]
MAFCAQIPHKSADLVPSLSVDAVDLHYDRHHCGYAKALNSLIKDTQYMHKTIEDIIIKSRGVDQEIFNNAAQLFNHDFYWRCLKVPSYSPDWKIATMVEDQFGTFEDFLNEYVSFANTMFGSGWSWVVFESEKLFFLNTQNAETPIGTKQKAVCV